VDGTLPQKRINDEEVIELGDEELSMDSVTGDKDKSSPRKEPQRLSSQDEEDDSEQEPTQGEKRRQASKTTKKSPKAAVRENRKKKAKTCVFRDWKISLLALSRTIGLQDYYEEAELVPPSHSGKDKIQLATGRMLLTYGCNTPQILWAISLSKGGSRPKLWVSVDENSQPHAVSSLDLVEVKEQQALTPKKLATWYQELKAKVEENKLSKKVDPEGEFKKPKAISPSQKAVKYQVEEVSFISVLAKQQEILAQVMANKGLVSENSPSPTEAALIRENEYLKSLLERLLPKDVSK
jgi:hypothetical protein